jgi:hypothetical protein
MPMHDWTLVEAGIFHAFHHRWISAISDDLNDGKLPPDYYALPEQVASGFGPAILALQERPGTIRQPEGGTSTVMRPPAANLQTRPQTRFMAESETEFYKRKKSAIAIRHVSGDRVVALIEIVSPGNKSHRHALQSFVDKTHELLEYGVHLLIVDPFPPGPWDPDGIHAAIWAGLSEVPYHPPEGSNLTAVAYECDLTTHAYIEPLAAADVLPDMPLFLEPNGCVMAPLEATYQIAFAVLPRRWRDVLAPPGTH